MLLPALAGILELGLREVAMDQPEQSPVTVGLERDLDGAEIRAGVLGAPGEHEAGRWGDLDQLARDEVAVAVPAQWVWL